MDLFLSSAVAGRRHRADLVRSICRTLDEHILGLDLVNLLRGEGKELVAQVLREGDGALVLVLWQFRGSGFRGTSGRVNLLHGYLEVVHDGCESLREGLCKHMT